MRQLVAGRCALDLDQVVVAAVGGEQGAGVLEVLAFRVVGAARAGRVSGRDGDWAHGGGVEVGVGRA